MFIEFQLASPSINGSPQTAENRTLCRARALSKREAFVASGRGRRQAAEAGADLRSKYADSPRNASTRYRCDADRAAACRAPQQRRVRRAFPMEAQAESASRNPRSDWDVVSGWRLKRKIHPGILIRNGMQFPNEWLAESPSRNRPSERDVLSAGRPALLNSKTYTPSIPKLGRRRPKRNSRRST